jgi:hypothetical protein
MTEAADTHAPPKRKRRWFQFSLRSLMIGVTLLALVCWVIRDRQRLIQERDQARDLLNSARQDLDDIHEASYRSGVIETELETPRAWETDISAGMTFAQVKSAMGSLRGLWGTSRWFVARYQPSKLGGLFVFRRDADGQFRVLSWTPDDSR